jgi:hypothetical protein
MPHLRHIPLADLHLRIPAVRYHSLLFCWLHYADVDTLLLCQHYLRFHVDRTGCRVRRGRFVHRYNRLCGLLHSGVTVWWLVPGERRTDGLVGRAIRVNTTQF